MLSRSYEKYIKRMSIPKELKKVKLPPKPEPDVSINIWDRFRLWLDKSLGEWIGKAIRWVVPSWVWWAFLGIMVSLALIFGLLK